MLKTKKRLTALLLIVGLAVTAVIPSSRSAVYAEEGGAYDDLYMEALTNTTAKSLYKTETVRKGTFSIYYTTMPRPDYDDYSYLYNMIPVGDVEFVSYMSKKGDWLEVGDPVCKIEVKVDEARIAELEGDIQKEEDMLNTYAQTCEELLDKYDRMYQSGGSDAELAKLLYDRLKLEYDEEIKKRRESIDALQSEYDGLKMAQVMTEIPATAPGYVLHLESFVKGRRIEPYGFVGVMYRPDAATVKVEGGSDYLRYGLNAQLVQNDGKVTRTVDGMVVTSLDSSLPPSLIGKATVFDFGDRLREFNPQKDVILKVERVHMENALMVPNKAVYNDSHGDYVLVSVNGKKTRRYVLVGGSNDNDTWIVNGIGEGDSVIIK